MRSEVVQRSGEVIMIRDRKYNEKNHQTYISSEIQIPQYQIDLGLVQVQCHSALVLGFDSNSASSLGDIVAAVLATLTVADLVVKKYTQSLSPLHQIICQALSPY